MNLNTFILETARNASRRRNLTDAETEGCRKYLEVVYHSYASSAHTSASSGALILQATGGELQHLLVPDLLEVLYTPREIFERAANLFPSIENEHVLQEKLLHASELSRERTLSRDADLSEVVIRAMEMELDGETWATLQQRIFRITKS